MNLTTLYKKLTNGKYLIGLLIGFVGTISFCSATIYSVESDTLNCVNGAVTYDLLGLPTFLTIKDLGDGGNYNLCFTCENNVAGSCSNQLLQGGQSFTKLSESLAVGCNGGGLSKVVVKCKSGGDDFSLFYSGTTAPCGGSCPECPTCPEVPECPEVNTGEILSGYILESEIDTNYCVGNGLCPNECGSGEEMTGTNRSSLFINNIQYPGAPTIKFTIPEEIQREQNTDEEETNIDVIGYGYDQDKMQQMVNTQYYKPTAEEMSGLMEKVADFLPLVAVALLIIRIRRIIKKVF